MKPKLLPVPVTIAAIFTALTVMMYVAGKYVDYVDAYYPAPDGSLAIGSLIPYGLSIPCAIVAAGAISMSVAGHRDERNTMAVAMTCLILLGLWLFSVVFNLPRFA